MSSKLYSVDVPIWATLYIKADSPEEAAIKARHFSHTSFEVKDGTINIDDRPLDDCFDEDEFIGLSPAMTVGEITTGIWAMETAFDPDEDQIDD